jgi:hypothetical protein
MGTPQKLAGREILDVVGGDASQSILSLNRLAFAEMGITFYYQ